MLALDRRRATSATANANVRRYANTREERVAGLTASLLLWNIIHDTTRRAPMGCGKMISKNGTQTGTVPGKPDGKGK